MKQLQCCLLLLVLSATIISRAAETPASSTVSGPSSIVLHVPGINVEQYVPRNLLAVEHVLLPQAPGASAIEPPNGNIRSTEGVVEPNQKILTITSQNWDTVAHAWATSYTLVNTYNASGDLTEGISQSSYPPGSAPVNSSRTAYSYDANHNPTEYIYYSWQSNAWSQTSRTVMTYDGSNRVATQIQYSWSAGAWVEQQKTIFSYSASNNPTEYLNQIWFNGAWINSTKNVYVFNASNKQIEYTYYSWVSNAWVGQTHNTYTYDANSHMTGSLTQTGNAGAWTNRNRTTATWDANGDNTETLNESWNASAWTNSSRTVQTYNAFHGATLSTYYSWVSGAWVSYFRTTTSYDASHRASEYYQESYTGGAWVYSSHTTYTYDAAGNYATFTSQTWKNGTWLNSSKAIYTWYGVVAGVREAPALAAGYTLNANYPNPFNPSTTISYNVGKVGQVTLTVFDMLGREVATLINGQQSSGSHEARWNAGTAASGLYYYRLTAGGFTLMKSMVLVK